MVVSVMSILLQIFGLANILGIGSCIIISTDVLVTSVLTVHRWFLYKVGIVINKLNTCYTR